MPLLSTILAFVIALGLLIAFHEFGHYLVARWCGVKVLRFSLGFGRPLLTRRWGRDQTEWTLAAIPLGGYVKMLDEREGHVPAGDQDRAFNRQPVSKRFAIVAAGPLANFLLAILLYWFLFVLGVNGVKPVLGEITSATPAAQAGFKVKDTISEIDGQPVMTWQEARLLLLDQAVDKKAEIAVTVLDEYGMTRRRVLDLSHFDSEDLDNDFLNKTGLSIYRPVLAPVIGRVVENSAAEQAGLQEQDEIIALNEQKVTSWEDVVNEIRTHPGETLIVDIARGGQYLTLTLQPEAVYEGKVEIGKAGIAPQIDHEAMEDMLVHIRYSPGTALVKAVEKTWEMTAFTLRMLGKMVTGDVSLKNVSGPITIANYAGQTAQMGFAAYLGFLALISVSLGVLNLLPIPVLDGGHLAFYLIEMARGAPLSEKVMLISNQIGIALLIVLMVFALHNDLLRLSAG